MAVFRLLVRNSTQTKTPPSSQSQLWNRAALAEHYVL
jgi:hypothetical protein